MSYLDIVCAAREIHGGMNPYDDDGDGNQRVQAAEQAVLDAGVSRANRAFAVGQVLAAWDRTETEEEARRAAAQAAHDAQPDVVAAWLAAEEKGARKAAEEAAREAAAKAEAAATAHRREIGMKIASITGGASGCFFGTYSGRGEMVACPKGQPEVVVARRVDVTTGESAAEFGKYVAWGCPLESHTVSHWEATPDGERILSEWQARQQRITEALAKAAALREARERRERAAAKAAREAARAERMTARGQMARERDEDFERRTRAEQAAQAAKEENKARFLTGGAWGALDSLSGWPTEAAARETAAQIDRKPIS